MNKLLYITLLALFGQCQCVIKFSNKQSGISFTKTNSQLILEESISNVDGTIIFKDNSPSRVVSNSNKTITFSEGTTGVLGSEYSFTGTYDLGGSDTLILKNGDILTANGNRIYPQVSVQSGASAKITGTMFFDQNPILQPGASLTFAMDNELEKSFIVQGSNTLLLERSLKLANRVDLNTGHLDSLNLNDQDLIFNGTISEIGQIIGTGTVFTKYMSYFLNYDLNIQGQVNFIGNNSTISLAYGKKINFGPGFHSCSNIYIKDLGQTSSLTVDPLGTVFFNDVTLELFDDLTLSGKGTYVFTSDNCKIIPNGHKIFLDHGTHFVIDNCDLFFVPSNTLETNPIVLINSGSGPGILEFNGALAAITSTTKGLAVLDNTTITASSFSMNRNLELTQLSMLTVQNSTPMIAKTVSFNGNGYSLIFPTGEATQLFVVNPNTTLNLSNTYLKGFSSSLVFLGANSTLNFGENNNISLARDESLSSSFPLNFTSGNSYIDCYGHSLKLSSSNSIVINNGASATIKNAHIEISNPNAFYLSDGAKLVFQNCNIWLGTQGWNISSGNVDFLEKNEIFGADQTAILQEVPLVFSSSGFLTIKSLSTLTINKNIRATYRANPVNDSGSASASKRHWKFTNPSSTLELNGCTLVSSATAMAFDYGKLLIRDLVAFEIDSGVGHDVELGTAMEVSVLAGATFDVKGPLRQIHSSF